MFLLAQGERHLHIYGSNRDDIFFLLTLDRQNIKRDASVDNFNFNFASLEFVFEAILLKKYRIDRFYNKDLAYLTFQKSD